MNAELLAQAIENNNIQETMRQLKELADGRVEIHKRDLKVWGDGNTQYCSDELEDVQQAIRNLAQTFDDVFLTSCMDEYEDE